MRIAAFILLAIAISAPAAAAPAPDQARLDAIVDHALDIGRYPGISVVIEKDGRIIYEKGAGLADLETRRPVTPASVFPIGSITKSFTALAVMQLVAAGKISLADRVGHYLPALEGQAAGVVLRHLLDHSSGIPNYTSLPNLPNPQTPLSHEATMALVADKPLLFSPGERFSYSNSNSYLLGMIVEKVSGQAFADYLDEHIFKPFGMASTLLGDYRPIVPQRARGYELKADGHANAPYYHVDHAFSAGAIMSTARDLLRYRRGVFEAGLTSKQVRDNLQVRRPFLDGTLNYYAWGALISREFEGHRKLSHSGVIDGFSAHYSYYPDDKIVIVVLTNLTRGTFMPYAIEHRLARAVLGLKEPAIVDLTVPAAEASAFGGDYIPHPWIFDAGRYGFVAEGGRMYLRYEGIASGAPFIPLLYQGNGRFVAADDHEHSFTFDKAKPRARSVSVEFYDGVFPAARAPD